MCVPLCLCGTDTWVQCPERPEEGSRFRGSWSSREPRAVGGGSELQASAELVPLTAEPSLQPQDPVSGFDLETGPHGRVLQALYCIAL